MLRKAISKKLFVLASVITLSASSVLATARIAEAQGDDILDCAASDCNKSCGTVCCRSEACSGSNCNIEYVYKN